MKKEKYTLDMAYDRANIIARRYYNYYTKYLKDESIDLEDLVQEGRVRAWELYKKYKKKTISELRKIMSFGIGLKMRDIVKRLEYTPERVDVWDIIEGKNYEELVDDLNEDDNFMSLDSYNDEEGTTPDSLLVNIDRSNIFFEDIKKLCKTADDYDFLRKRFIEGYTLLELADMYKLTKQNMSLKEKGILAYLKTKLKIKKITLDFF